MTSDPTARLSAALADRYRIERQLGQGGMATVYLAQDLKHDRQVAIKVLKPELAAVLGAERFVQEIKTTAALQHPHILPLFDSGEANGFLFYVMPFIEGETLRDKLNRETQLGIDEAVKITVEVADALEYAHTQGVIHRDIKPENILLHAGRPMVADFGIALALSAAAGGRMTETGMSLGTPHYMSPEQATADKDITARSDVYSLASVLYEMLSGEPPHTGGSAQAIIMKIIAEPVKPVTQIRKSVPANVAAALGKALEKLPADRFATAKAFSDALTSPSFTTASAASTGAIPRAALRRYRTTIYALAGTCAVLAAVAAFFALRPTAAPSPSRERILLGTLTYPSAVLYGAAVSPDGSAIVYSDTVGGKQQLWIKERGDLDPRPLAPTSSQDPAGPSFSPDGQWIAYSNGALQKIARHGGAPIQLSDSAAAWSTAWLDDGTIAFIGRNEDRVFITTAEGGVAKRVVTADAVHGYIASVSPIPHERALLLSVAQLNGPKVFTLDLATDSVHDLGIPAGIAHALDDRLVYVQGSGQMLWVPFDAHRLAAHGTPTSILQGVRTVAGVGDLAAGSGGTLLYAEGAAVAGAGKVGLASVTRGGIVSPLDSAWQAPSVPNSGIGLSPDGSHLVLSVSDSVSGSIDIYVIRLATGIPTRLTFDGLTNIRPVWSGDGSRILYTAYTGGVQHLWSRRADGSGRPTEITLPETRPIFEGLWSPDGKWIIYRTDDAAPGNGDIYALRTSGDTTPVTITATSAEETGPAVSPDGRWIAFASNATGRKEVYVRPFPNAADGLWQVSSDGGAEAEWAHSGKELFYRNGNGDMVAVTVTGTPTFAPGAHQTLFNTRDFMANDDSHEYAVTPDDSKFILLRYIDAGTGDLAGRLVLVRNWMGVTKSEP